MTRLHMIRTLLTNMSLRDMSQVQERSDATPTRTNSS